MRDLSRTGAAAAAIALLWTMACSPIGARQPDDTREPAADAGTGDGDPFAFDPDAHPVGVGELVPDFGMVDAAGTPLSLRQLRGKVVLLTVFAASGGADDREILDRMATVEARLAPRLATEVTLVALLVGAGPPDREALRAAARRATRDEVLWIFAAPDPADVPAIAGALEIALWQSADGGLRHTFMVVIIDRNGRLADRFPGLDDWSAMDVVAAAGEVAGR